MIFTSSLPPLGMVEEVPNQYVQRFAGHAVHKTVAETKKALQSARDVLPPGDPTYEISVERATQVCDAVVGHLGSADPYLVAPGTLDNLHSFLTDLGNQARAYVANKNLGHLSNLDGPANSALGQLPALGHTPKSGLSSFVDSVVEARTRIRNQASELKRETRELREALDLSQKAAAKATEDIGTISRQVQTLLAEQKTAFGKEELDRERRFSEAVGKADAKFADLVKDQEAKATVDAKRRDEQFEAAGKALEGRLQGSLDTGKALLQETEKYCSDQKARVEELVKSVAITTLAGGFDVSRTKAFRRTIAWYGLAIATLVGLVWFGTSVVLPALEGGIPWEAYLARLSLTVPFILVATLAFKQASRAQHIEEQHNRLNLELSALESYLQGMPKELRETLRASLVPRYFRGEEPLVKGSDPANGFGAMMKANSVTRELTKP
jgi:hypothetical protein